VKSESKELVEENSLDPTCCVVRHITCTSRTVIAAFEAALRPAGVTAHQFTVLAALAYGGPMSVNTLADAVGMHPSTTPRKIAPLVRDGLVRVAQGSDRRQRVIALTTRGNKALQRAYPLWAKLQREILEELGPGAWPSIMQSLGAIRAGLAKLSST
jgi:DNA-binding MarR family transcriptional regulator